MAWFWGDMVTGNVTRFDVPVKEGYLAIGLRSAGSMNLSIPTPALNQIRLAYERSRGNARAKGGVPGTQDNTLGLLGTWRSFIGYEENGVILNAGPILSIDIHADTGVMTVNAAGMLAWLNDQLFGSFGTDSAASPGRSRPVEYPSPPYGPLTWTRMGFSSLTLRTIMKRVVRSTLINYGVTPPILTPEPDGAGTNERNYFVYETHSIGELLQQLSEVQGGPEFEIRPRFVDPETKSQVVWELITGDPEISQQVNTIGREDVNWFADPFAGSTMPSPATTHFLTFEQMYPNWNYYKANNVGTYPTTDPSLWDMGLKNFDTPTRVQYDGAWQFRLGASGTAVGGRVVGFRFADRPGGAVQAPAPNGSGWDSPFNSLGTDARLRVTLTNTGTAAVEVRSAPPITGAFTNDLKAGAPVDKALGSQRSYGMLNPGQTKTFTLFLGSNNTGWVKKYSWQKSSSSYGTGGQAFGLLLVKKSAAGNWGPVYIRDILLQKTPYAGQPEVPFAGSTANDSQYLYSWKGTAGRSVSIRKTIAGNAIPPIQIDRLGSGLSGIRGLTIRQTYSSFVTESWQVGAVPEGDERAHPNANAALSSWSGSPYSQWVAAPIDPTLPRRMVAESRSSVTNNSTLRSHGQAAVRRGNKDDWEWVFQVPKETLPFGTVRVGDYLDLKWQTVQEALPLTKASDTPYRLRVISIKYDFPGDYLELSCLPDW